MSLNFHFTYNYFYYYYSSHNSIHLNYLNFHKMLLIYNCLYLYPIITIIFIINIVIFHSIGLQNYHHYYLMYILSIIRIIYFIKIIISYSNHIYYRIIINIDYIIN